MGQLLVEVRDLDVGSSVAPMGDPIELRLRGYELTLRIDDAKNIVVEEE